MKKRWILIGIYVLIFVILALIVYALPSVIGLFQRTYVADHGSIRIENDVDAYIFRKESIYVAGKPCNIKRIAKEEELVSCNAEVVGMEAGGSDVPTHHYNRLLKDIGGAARISNNGKAKEAGYVSYYADGLEKALGKERIPKMGEASLGNLRIGRRKDLMNGNCSKGDPIFKIVENGPWGIVFFLDKGDAERYQIGSYVNIKFKDVNKSVGGSVVNIGQKGERRRIIVQSEDFFKGILKYRHTDIRITAGEADGIILRKKSIIKKDGKEGVIVKDKVGNLLFKPIMIKADNGKECAVYGDLYMNAEGEFVETVATYDEILSYPTDKDIRQAHELLNNRGRSN